MADQLRAEKIVIDSQHTHVGSSWLMLQTRSFYLLSLVAPSLSLFICVCVCVCIGLDDSTSSADSFLGPAAAAVLVFRPAPPIGARGLNGILVSKRDSNEDVQQFFVFSVSHGVVERFEKENLEIQHSNIRLLLLQPGEDTLSVDDSASFIELPWTRCVHTARAFWTADKDVTRFKSDCSVFELPADRLSAAVQARAVPLFDWRNNHKPSSKAVGVSLVRDEAQQGVQVYIEIRIEERVSAWAGAHVYLPSEVSAEGQSGTGLTDKKNRLVSVVSGNYEIGKKKCAVAVLVKQHLQLLEQGSQAESFVPAVQETRTPLTSTHSTIGEKRERPGPGKDEEQQQAKQKR